MADDCFIAIGSGDDIIDCSRIACNSEIGIKYEFTQEAISKAMLASIAQSGMLIVARKNRNAETKKRAASRILGFAWAEPKGAFGQAPYLKLIAVDEQRRSSGIGSMLLKEFEERTRNIGRAWFLLVSDFNERAISFYERHGYEKAGILRSFAHDGIDEIIMYKRHE
ncbi:MAG: Acetyltransferase (GNAT) family protein [Spirochaetes bacterium ADurb.Bin110]|nr:MAG: Acetyltransferase (GNAT) family protein [Spirochaetes bacterium ADurb.Bin110]